MMKSLVRIAATLFAMATVSAAALAQPAPGLTSVSVTRVKSSAVPGGENINSNMFSTSRDHSGPLLQVETFDFGYSSYREATFGGRSMREVSSQAYPSRGPAIGFFRVWQIQTPYTSGNFTYKANSRTTGYRYYTSLNIR